MKKDHVANLLRRLQSGYSLPSLSLIAIKLIEMASDDQCTIKNLANLIEKDPSLAIRLLRIANSAFFRTIVPAATLDQAVLRIGIDRLRIMVLSLSLRDTFPMGSVGPMDYEQFWRSSLYQGLIARSLAVETRSCDPEEAFLAGLTCEIGLLIFFDLFLKGGEEIRKLHIYPLESLLGWERRRFGVDHRQMGEAALRYWKFPGRIVDCQRFHGVKIREKGTPPLATICEVARELSALICQKASEFKTALSRAEEILDLDHEVINDILMTTFEQVEEIAGSLKVEVNKERDIMELMQKANAALGELSQRISTGRDAITGSGLPSFENLGAGSERRALIAHTLQAVAHEIRNPLLAVGGFARRLAATLDPDSEGGKYVQVILEETMRLEKTLLELTEDRDTHE